MPFRACSIELMGLLLIMPNIAEVITLIDEFYSDKPDAIGEKAELLSELDGMNDAEQNEFIESTLSQAFTEFENQEYKTMKDGTEYKVTPKGWRKLDS